MVKVNVDFAVDEGNGTHDFGIIIRDDKGDFIAAKSIRGWGVMNSDRGILWPSVKGSSLHERQDALEFVLKVTLKWLSTGL